jgi:hypothetical protein
MKSFIQAKPLSVIGTGGYFEAEQFNSSIKEPSNLESPKNIGSLVCESKANEGKMFLSCDKFVYDELMERPD